MSTTTHQGAEGAETTTAGPDCFRELLAAARPFYACVFNDNGDVSISTGNLTVHHWLRLDRAFAAASKNPALSTPAPRTDGGMTAGEGQFRPGDLVRNARYDHRDAYPAFGESAYVQAVDGDYLDFGQGSKLLYSLFDLATPAQPAGAVPESLRALSEAATKGEWYTESEKCDGSYGSGEDCGEGYLAYSILTDAEPRYGNPGVIAETINSTLGVIHEESDEDGFTAWDETARANTAFIVAAVNHVRALLSTHPAGQSAGQRAKIAVDVQTMRASNGTDYYVRITCDGREVTPHCFKERWKAEYEAAHYAWIFGLRADEPSILAFDPTSRPNTPAGLDGGQAVAARAKAHHDIQFYMDSSVDGLARVPRQRLAEWLGALASATPAQPAGAVPESLRAVLDRAITEWRESETGVLSIDTFRALVGVHERLATHPAGQSAGSGADGKVSGSVEIIERCVKLAQDAGLDSVTISGSLFHWRNILAKLNESAPDSTRTGDEGTDYDQLARELMGFHHQLDGGVGDGAITIRCESETEQTRLNLRAVLREAAAIVLAARPAAPETAVIGDLGVLQQAAESGRLRIECRERLNGADPDAGMIWPIEVELPCINGLSAWFTLGNIYSPDRAAQGYTDGALSDDLARALAAHIIRSLTCPAAPEAQGAVTPWKPISTAPRNDTLVMLGWWCDVGGDPRWIAVAGWYEAGPADRCWYAAYDEERIEPTHWRPLDRLPAPPSSGQEG